MKVLYGTTNPAKIEYMKEILKGLDIEIIGLNDVDLDIGSVEEVGNSPLENARIKAINYSKYVDMPVFSCDTGLYIKGLEVNKQPGVYVRRIDGEELSDEEMITYYSHLAESLGGQVDAKYMNAICLVVNGIKIYEYDGEDIASREFIITKDPHNIRTKGFPLDSISIDMKTKKYFVELDEENDDEYIETNTDAYRSFFRTSLKTKQSY